MHVIVAILLFSSLCAAQTKSDGTEIASEYKAVQTKCIQKIGVTADFVEDNSQKGYKDDADEKFKCVVACIYENELKLKDDGSLDIEGTSMIVGRRLKDVERNDVIKAVQACSNIIVLLFSSVCTATKEEEEFKSELAECGNLAGVTEDYVKDVFKSGLKGADENLKCFIACLIQDSYKVSDLKSYFNDGGAFDAERTIANDRGPAGLLRDYTSKALRACSNIKGYSECDAIFQVYKCMVENVKILFNARNDRPIG
ncbi:hypothetical protein TSAR_015571 [Trichomalopsis sarcophagae]|uniref:Uncharacterized protein n=1 Tax=Trichomalopsis sarcophagae TaxID=543379 RepID=A0A232F6F8_9HYME|nr:hypothetical protein TSAR_015571 [Trichomalopsis sarcophagae]